MSLQPLPLVLQELFGYGTGPYQYQARSAEEQC